jgi:hypothetical protein
VTPYGHELGDTIQVAAFAQRFQVISRAHGEFGVVYGVRDSRSGAVRALKTLRTDLEVGEKSLRQFQWEANVWTGLPACGSLVAAHTVHRYNSRPYVETEYVYPRQYGSSYEGLLYEVPPDMLLDLKTAVGAILDLTFALKKSRSHNRD